MMILAADHILPAAGSAWIEDGGLLIADGRIKDSGSRAEIVARWPQVSVIDLGHAAILPGFVNAHQHGRGLSQMLLGYADDALEPWIAGRRRHGPPDIYAVTRLAAEAMLANGVTATLHANYAYGSGDYEQELDATIRAYANSGLRATICVGYQDRGHRFYPGNDGTRSDDVPLNAPYASNLKATFALMDRLQAQWAGTPTLSFAYGPAGPQWVSDEAWRALAADAVERQVGLHFHLLESPAQAQACRDLYPEGTLARLSSLGVFHARTSCAHGVYLGEPDLRVARDNDLVIVANPGSNLRLFNGMPPLASILAAGCTLAVGTDNCALSDDEDYLRELRLATVAARVPGIEGAGPSAHQALALATRNGGRAAFLPENSGVLDVGAPADLIALALDRIAGAETTPPIELLDLILGRGHGGDVVLTMTDGLIRYRAGEADRQRLARWQSLATRSARARSVAETAETVAALQSRIRDYYTRAQ
ncbi:amidohydrolase family protein [Aurantimonas aggregata]|uniref:Amidohydrolase family protein n=1 Tax=Aurantimonas aggregata TaxID=2047720 RepID=A0A6L9MIH6_9HYPH|nr:amidohydrolase family protein [Aurantimonas aggregata]NDV87673.1 amidohydrolase family protein [Aurantimonas aggregata]